jgi:hypothetical protein
MLCLLDPSALRQGCPPSMCDAVCSVAGAFSQLLGASIADAALPAGGSVFASQNSGLVPGALSALTLPPASRTATCGLLPLRPARAVEAEAILGKGMNLELLFSNH